MWCCIELMSAPQASAEHALMVFTTSCGHQKSPSPSLNLKVVMERRRYLGFQRSETLDQLVSVFQIFVILAVSVALPNCSHLNVQLLVLDLAASAAWPPAFPSLWCPWIHWERQPSWTIFIYYRESTDNWFRLCQTPSWLWWEEKYPILARWG